MSVPLNTHNVTTIVVLEHDGFEDVLVSRHKDTKNARYSKEKMGKVVWLNPVQKQHKRITKEVQKLHFILGVFFAKNYFPV